MSNRNVNKLINIFGLILISFIISLNLNGQVQSNVKTITIDSVSNSFQSYFANKFPAIKYSYNAEKKIHDYSGNWDIDGDGVSDSILFIGNDGAHIYFYFSITLSSEIKPRIYQYLVTDYPLYEPSDALKSDNIKYFPKFSINDFNLDGNPDIYLNIGTVSGEIPSELIKEGIKTNSIYLYFKDKNMHIKNYDL